MSTNNPWKHKQNINVTLKIFRERIEPLSSMKVKNSYEKM